MTDVTTALADRPGAGARASSGTRGGYDPLERPTGWTHSRAVLFGEMLVFGLLSLTAAFVLSYDAVVLAANPTATLACDVNTVLSCGTVAQSWQAQVFGFPNAFLGLVAEPIVITVAVASLGGTRFPRWFLFAAQCVHFLGVVFAYWLFYQSMVVIGALCPWCLLITVSTTLVFASLLHWNVLEDNLYLPRRAQERLLGFVRSGAYGYLVAAWLVALAILVVVSYGPALLA
ncbi:vitamin K epoxide reductase family protein [Cellulosimicrobium marinum]|uniref:vitamin K epoxide reductase family protein n=1 Tax=Cellulosimicrobium marinum TaxID=1638992 RepID=UPI001E53DDA3|nr:vitamin K epoxide reductase family protein [Cellulosimicrobium marinum]MCB7135266.1 vitamin K epoxide reductase family protein [Cellulosimicrobium marinum]